MFRSKKGDAASTALGRARPRSRSFSEHPTDYLGLDDDVSAAKQHRPAHNACSNSSSTRRTRSRSRGPKSNNNNTATTSSRRGRSLSRGRRSNNGSNACTSNGSKGGSFLETLRRRSRSRSRPRNTRGGANKTGAGNAIDPNERWQSIVKTTGILSSQPNKQHHEMNVRSENGFVGSRSGVDGRIVQGSRLPPAPPMAVPACNDTTRREREARSNIRPERQGKRPIPPQRTKRAAPVSKSQTEYIRAASSSSSRSKAVSAVCNRTKVAAPKPSGRHTTTAQYRQKPRRRHSFDGISDPRILELEDELGSVEDCHEEFRDHHTVTTASVRTAWSSQDRSRKSSLGQNSRRSAGSSGRSSASVGRPRGVQRPSPPLRRDDQQVPDASRSAPSMIMSHQPMPSGAASVRSRDSRTSSCRSAPVVSGSRRHASGPVPTVDSIRLRASQQRKQQTSNRLKHSQQSMDDFRPPGLLVDHQPTPVQRQHANYNIPTKAANGDEGHLEALKDHEGPSGGTVPRPITRAASRGRGQGRREYYQDNDNDDLMKRSHRSLGRSRSRSIRRRARKEERRAERKERAERMMRRRASSMSRRRSSKDAITDDSLGDDEEGHRSNDGHQKEEAVVSSGNTSPRSTTKPWAEEYLNLRGTNSSDDEREWEVDNVNQSLPAAPVESSADSMNRNEAVTDTEAGTDDMNDLQKRLMRLAAGRNRRAESKSEPANTTSRYSKQEISKDHDAWQNSFARAVAIEDVDEDVFSSRHRHASSPKRSHRQGNQNAKSLHSSASTTEGTLDSSLHFHGERIDHNGNEKHQSTHRCVLEDPFGLLDPDNNSSDSEQFKTADGWVKRNYEGGKAA